MTKGASNKIIYIFDPTKPHTMNQPTPTTIPAHLPKFVHLCDGDQLLNVEARTIQSFDQSYEVFSLDEAFLTADDIAQFYNDLTEAVGSKIGDELFIFLMNN